ncbi:MAG: hypothetical protein HY686_05685 [Chloroflexi bacterium]|nr:hypothetical protein [Chloroflexota bacterium]
MGLLGYLVQGYLPYIRFVGGALLIFMGFHVMGLWRIPFLVTALAINRVTGFLRWLRRYRWAVSAVSGVFLIVVGVLMMTNMFAQIPRFFYWGAL